MCERQKKEPEVYLTGTGMGAYATLTNEALEVMKDCDCIIGAKRMTEALEHIDRPAYTAYRAEEIKAIMKSHAAYDKIVVALSGDPGFYSGAKALKEALSGCRVHIIPGISSVSYLASRLQVSWEDAALISTHGRRQNYIYTIAHHEKTFLLLGGKEGADELCRNIRCYGLGDTEFYIGRHLSYGDERIIHKTGNELCAEDFSGLDAAFIRNPCPDRRTAPHIGDEEFVRGGVPMTKAEVRAVSISKLKLTEDAVLYDIGAGTGSVSIEAALHSGEMKVYAIEKNPEAAELLQKNIQKFRCDHVEIVQGRAPEVLRTLAPPTHVFVGGSGGNLKEILRLVKEKNPAVRIVINAASLETLSEIIEAEKEGILSDPKIVQIAASRARKLGEYHMMEALNPVYIVAEGKGAKARWNVQDS